MGMPVKPENPAPGEDVFTEEDLLPDAASSRREVIDRVATIVAVLAFGSKDARQLVVDPSAPQEALGELTELVASKAVWPLEPGGQLKLGTRVEQGAVVVEIESLGCDLDDHLPARAETLCDFLDNLGGNCTVHREQDDLYIVLELPQVLAADPRDRA